MCLSIIGQDFKNQTTKALKPKPKPIIAKKGFYVYKWLKANNESPYRMMPWFKGYRYIEPTFGYNMYSYVKALDINRGLHAFTSETAAVQYKYRNDVSSYRCHKIVKMWVPKGAKYHINTEKGEICSNKITWH